MSYVIAAPEMMTSAATDLATIGSNVSAAHMAVAAPTVALVPAAADEVSTGIAHLFSRHAQGYQALAGQAAAFHGQFVQHLTASARSYAATEAANASLLQPLNAAAGTFSSTVLGQVLNMFAGQMLNLFTQTFPAVVQQFLNSIGTAPPLRVLENALLILTFPAYAVLNGALSLFLDYLLVTGQLNVF
jgi:PE family